MASSYRKFSGVSPDVFVLLRSVDEGGDEVVICSEHLLCRDAVHLALSWLRTGDRHGAEVWLNRRVCVWARADYLGVSDWPWEGPSSPGRYLVLRSDLLQLPPKYALDCSGLGSQGRGQGRHAPGV